MGTDAYPNGRCAACGFGLDRAGRCYNVECTAFDEDSEHGHHAMIRYAVEQMREMGDPQLDNVADLLETCAGYTAGPPVTAAVEVARDWL